MFRGFVDRQSVVFQLDERSLCLGRETHDESSRARRYRLVARLAPGDLDQVRALDAHEMPTDDHAVDVDGEQTTRRRSRPFLTCLDESRPIEHSQVLRYTLLRHLHLVRDLPNRARALLKELEDLDASRLAQRLQGQCGCAWNAVGSLVRVGETIGVRPGRQPVRDRTSALRSER